MYQFLGQRVLLFILCLSVNEITCDCHKTFVTHCDNLYDYLKYDSDAWRQLIIGNSNVEPIKKWSLFDIWYILDSDLGDLEWLTINNQLHGELDEDLFINVKHKKLKYLQFYKNNLNNYHLDIFSSLPSIIELNLVNNNIKQIIGGGDGETIDTVDFSENNLTEIKENTFIDLGIRQLIIKSNQLSSIEANTFNESLEILNLDRNEFGYIPDDSLENLVNLKVLTMSHNQISSIPKLDFLKSIEKFDFSYNKITNIRTKFQTFPHLKHIDLSHNLIKRINFVSLIPHNDFPKKISLAFNYLTQFELSAEEWRFNFTAPVTLILFGNPWICQCLVELDLFLKNRPIKRTECDLSLFGDGRFPHCVNQEFCVSYSTTFDTSFYTSFLNVLNESKQHFTCNIDLDMLMTENIKKLAHVSLPKAVHPARNEFIPII